SKLMKIPGLTSDLRKEIYFQIGMCSFHFQEYFCSCGYIQVAVFDDSRQVILVPVCFGYHAPVHLFLGRADIKDRSQQIQGNIMLIIAESPQLQCVDMGVVPWFHSSQL